MQHRSRFVHKPVPPSGWLRLWQPRRGLFWLMLAFNLLSTLMAWALRTDGLSPVATVLVAVLALGNATMGMWVAWRLVKGA